MSQEWTIFQSAKTGILSAHGISAPEWIVLDSVRLRIPLPPDELARFLVGYMKSFPDAPFTAPEFFAAIGSLVEKGLLYVLTFADAVRPAPLYSAWNDDQMDGLEGRLDFTPTGFALMKEVSDAHEAQFHRPLLRKRQSLE